MPTPITDFSRQLATPVINMPDDIDALSRKVHAQSLDGLEKVADRGGHQMLAAAGYSATGQGIDGDTVPAMATSDDTLDEEFDDGVDEIDYEL